uniref:Reverse transcriptase domain-containing protein n=1 Tax=Tanacetum cinerariifolium TaxID=118510 RepID=A0A6L2N5B0_TANCI|nr:hypothetical protein [Tanacetum cinerariifolium]
MNDSMIELRETFQAWLQQQVVNLDSYTPEPSQCRKTPIYYDDDDDEESSTPLRDIIISELSSCIAITPVLSTEEPKDSLIMGDEHLDTIPEKESDKSIKSSVENLVPTQVSPRMNVNVMRRSEFNPIHNEDLDSTPKNDRFDIESYLLESLLNRDTLMDSSPKIDSLLDEFTGELIFLKSIPPGIDEADCDLEEDIHFVERFDPFMEEIDLFLASDGSIRPGIDSDYSDSEGDNLFLERLLHDDPVPLPDILDFSNVVRVFLPFFTYPVTSSILLSSGSEDTILTPASPIIISLL